MRPFLLTSLLLLFSAGVFAQSDTTGLLEADTIENSIHSFRSYTAASNVAYSQGFFVSIEKEPTDSLTLLLNDHVESEIWRSKSWEWTQRENSAIGGIQYDALNPYISPELDGWHQFSRSYLSMPNYHSASSPKTDLTVLTGIGGCQLFGLKTMSPVDSAKQLWVDYLRSNALGLYRNEGTDGHELNIKMRQDGVYKDGKRTFPLHGFEFSYFSSRSGQNGGLNSSDFFESNVPTLRRNFSVANDRGELYEEQLRFMYYRHLKDVTLIAQLKSAAWAVQSDLQQTEYFWDSTDVIPQLDSRTLYYNDSLRLTSAEVTLHYDKTLGGLGVNGAYYAINAHAGIENLRSNSGGWDAFRTDSSAVSEAFDNIVQPYVRAQGTLALERDGLLSFRGTYAVNIIGFNAGGYDLRNNISVLQMKKKETLCTRLTRTVAGCVNNKQRETSTVTSVVLSMLVQMIRECVPR